MKKFAYIFALLTILFSITAYARFTFVSAATDNSTQNTTNITGMPDFDITNISTFPYTSQGIPIGDFILTLYIKNTGNEDITNVVPFISGEGIYIGGSSKLDLIVPNQTTALNINVNSRKAGAIGLQIKLVSDQLTKQFDEALKIYDANATLQAKQAEDQKKISEQLNSTNIRYNNLSNLYSKYENDYQDKRANGFDVDYIDLGASKTYLDSAYEYIIKKDPDNANIKLNLADLELASIKKRLDSATPPTVWSKIKNNLLIVGGIAGAIVASFTAWEILKKKREHVSRAIKESHKKTLKLLKKKKKK